MLASHRALHMCRDPFTKPRGWLTWGLLGIVLSPVVIGVTVALLTYSGYEVSSSLFLSTAIRLPVKSNVFSL